MPVLARGPSGLIPDMIGQWWVVSFRFCVAKRTDALVLNRPIEFFLSLNEDRFIRLFDRRSSSRCYLLYAESPDATAEVILRVAIRQRERGGRSAFDCTDAQTGVFTTISPIPNNKLFDAYRDIVVRREDYVTVSRWKTYRPEEYMATDQGLHRWRTYASEWTLKGKVDHLTAARDLLVKAIKIYPITTGLYESVLHAAGLLSVSLSDGKTVIPLDSTLRSHLQLETETNAQIHALRVQLSRVTRANLHHQRALAPIRGALLNEYTQAWNAEVESRVTTEHDLLFAPAVAAAAQRRAAARRKPTRRPTSTVTSGTKASRASATSAVLCPVTGQKRSAPSLEANDSDSRTNDNSTDEEGDDGDLKEEDDDVAETGGSGSKTNHPATIPSTTSAVSSSTASSASASSAIDSSASASNPSVSVSSLGSTMLERASRLDAARDSLLDAFGITHPSKRARVETRE